MRTMRLRRALVLTDEHARHPFRASLPPHVCGTLIMEEEAPQRRSFRQVFDEDWKRFLSAYCATFVAVTTFLA